MTIEALSRFYAGKRIFLTGHTGFKGAWLTLWLSLMGAEVKGFSLAPDEDALYTACDLDNACRSEIGDIRSLETLTASIATFRPEIVFHLAAQPLVRESYRIPVETFATNIMGTAHLLEACRSCDSVASIVVITTDKCYRNEELDRQYREDDPLGGEDPYSASKAGAELVTHSYYSSFFRNGQVGRPVVVTSARAGNVIGGGDWAKDRIIPDCIRSLLRNEPVGIRNPQSIRPWQHVLEPLWGYLLLGTLRDEAFSGGWNFGPDCRVPVPVRRIVELTLQTWGGGDWRDTSDPDALHEAGLLQLDNRKAGARLGWEPLMDVEQTVAFTVAWYKRYRDNPEEVREFTSAQIREFERMLRMRQAD